MTDSIRIANCSGFYGDRLSAAAEMVNDGPIDVLTGDWLAELTMLILARTQAKRPNGGYARSFVTQMEQVMATCMEKNIKVVILAIIIFIGWLIENEIYTFALNVLFGSLVIGISLLLFKVKDPKKHGKSLVHIDGFSS